MSRFLGDPQNQFRSKRIIFELFANPHQYPVLMEYLLSLDEQYGFVIDSEHVVACPLRKLGGLCRKLAVVSEETDRQTDRQTMVFEYTA